MCCYSDWREKVMSFYPAEHQNVKRGDIFYIQNAKFYSTDPENTSGRPGVIVSCDELNAHSTVVEVVYLTTKDKRPMPTHTEVLCKVPSTSICENISTVPKERLGDFVRACTDREMAAIDQGLLHSLGIVSAPVVERERERARNLTSRKFPLRRICTSVCMNSFSIG